MNTRMFLASAPSVALGIAMLLPVPSFGFEADVHFGLTRWLALRAGFTPSQADAIATGDQRVDAGLVESTQLDLEYACAGRFPAVSRLAPPAPSPPGHGRAAAPG